MTVGFALSKGFGGHESVLVTKRGRENEPVGTILSAAILLQKKETSSTEELRNFHPEIVLFRPQIPPNTGTIVRLAAAVCCRVHIIEPTGFELSEKSLRRAGLDYWEHAEVFCHPSWEAFLEWRKPTERRFVFAETGGTQSPFEFQFFPGDILVFGAETFGIPKPILEDFLQSSSQNFKAFQNTQHQHQHALVTLPIFHTKVRSLNLSNTVSVVTYCALASVSQQFSTCM